MKPEEVKSILRKAFPSADIEVLDPRGSGDHFDIHITAAEFEGKSLIERHRMVYQALGGLMEGAIHAASLTTKAPHE